MTWLEARGLDVEICDRFGLETAAVPGAGGEWISIPYREGGRTVNHKYRRLDEKDHRQDKGGRQIWWNHEVVSDSTLAGLPLIVTEGEFDALAALSSGFVRVVSVPGGAPSSPSESNARYGFVAESLEALRGCREIILATDSDKPGQALLHDLSIRLGVGRCKFVGYPEGCKDLNDVLLAHGQAGVHQVIGGARWCRVPGLFRMSELPAIPDIEPMSTMIHGMHEHYNIRRGDLCVITGVPGSGKSTFVTDVCCRMADHYGWGTVFASFEQHPQCDHRRQLRTWRAGKPEARLSDGEIAAADAWIDEHFGFIIPDDERDATLDWLLDTMAAGVIRFGADLCVIDPWNELDHTRPREQALTDYVSDAIRQLKAFARRFNVHMIVVAHPTKLARDRSGQIPAPTMYDIADSAHWYNKPDVGIIVHPQYDETARASLTRVRVAKSRYHDRIGKPGYVDLSFNAFAARYEAP